MPVPEKSARKCAGVISGSVRCTVCSTLVTVGTTRTFSNIAKCPVETGQFFCIIDSNVIVHPDCNGEMLETTSCCRSFLLAGSERTFRLGDANG